MKKEKKKEKKHLAKGIIVAMAVIGTMTAVGMAIKVYYAKRILPGIKVAGTEIGGMQMLMALERLRAVEEKNWQTDWVEVEAGGVKFRSSRKDLNVRCDIKATTQRAFLWGRDDWKELWRNEKNLGWVCIKGGPELEKWVGEIAQVTEIVAREPRIWVENGKEIMIDVGKSGREVDREMTERKILGEIAERRLAGIEAIVNKLNWELTENEAEYNRMRAQKLLGSGISLKYKDRQWVWEGEKLIETVSLPAGFEDGVIGNWLDEINEEIATEKRDAKMVFAADKVVEFDPGQMGINVDKSRGLNEMIVTLNKLIEKSDKIEIELPTETEKPSNEIAELNNLAIKELIGSGESSYKGSIPNRIWNLTLAASRARGMLVAPGETFSFNKYLGDVSAATGYKQAYVIEKGRTVLGDGGGICQVSTTLFRSVLNAGLPVIERKAHAYRVGYYEQDAKPGLDATVFSPSVDFKFKNDTPGYILVWNTVDKGNYKMKFDLYGTRDGREVELSVPKILSQTPSLPDLWQDDPTMPVGTVKQVDWKANGAKVIFDYTVRRNGEILFEKQFVSAYRPWQAVFLRGTKI